MIEYQEYTKLNNYNKQDKILSKLAVRYPNRFSDSLARFYSLKRQGNICSPKKSKYTKS